MSRTSLQSRPCIVLVALVMAVAVALVSAQPPQTPRQLERPGVTLTQYTALTAALVEAGAPVRDGFVVIQGDGVSMALRQTPPIAGGGGMSAPALGGGWDRYGPYVRFSLRDQQTIRAIGHAGTVALICRYAPTQCAVAGVIAAGVIAYIGSSGLCPSYRPNLRYYVIYPYSRTRTGCYR